MIDNNQDRLSFQAEILASGTIAQNTIRNNYIFGGPTQNAPGVLVTQGAINYVSGNIGVGTTSNNLGNVGFVASVSDGNIDAVSGAQSPQCFCFELVNNSGTLQHIFYADSS